LFEVCEGVWQVRGRSVANLWATRHLWKPIPAISALTL
jgi:hypothetical protein